MKHTISNVFPQPLIKYKMTDESFELIKDVFYNEVRPKLNYRNRSCRGGITNWYNDTSIFAHYPKLAPVKEELTEMLNHAYNEILHHQTDVFITNAWFNEADLQSTQGFHNHVNSLLSGTLYVHADEYTFLDFQNPFDTLPGVMPTIQDKPNLRVKNKHGYSYHLPYTRFKPENGDVLIWNSYLIHGYQENETPNRVSMSFNSFAAQVNNLYQIKPL